MVSNYKNNNHIAPSSGPMHYIQCPIVSKRKALTVTNKEHSDFKEYLFFFFNFTCKRNKNERLFPNHFVRNSLTKLQFNCKF